MASQGYHEELLRHWFPVTEQQSERKSFAEKDIREISSILERAEKKAWSRIPRIYIVLRLTGQLNAIESFVQEGISDTWFPFTQRSLPDGLRGRSERSDFLENQRLVCNTKALNLERAGTGHGHFPNPSEVPLKKVGELGKGGSGFVERVISTITHREYALKLIKRGHTFRQDKQVLRDFEKELSNLKRLSQAHKHIIELVGSYTEPRYVGILFPVADCNLAEFLGQTELDKRRWSLRSYFGCLTSALGFLHDNKIRHKDIKPQNVLIKNDEPHFTDFGVSIDWTEYGHSTTFGPTAMTPRYGAPEVAACEPRNSSSDIWSLGCVFLEMWTTLKGGTMKDLTDFFTIDGRLLPYHAKAANISSWIDRVQNLPGPMSDNLPSVWIKRMLERAREDRWSAYLLVEKIRECSVDSSAQYLYIGRCCLDDEETGESVTSHAEDVTIDSTIKPSPNPLPEPRTTERGPSPASILAPGQTLVEFDVSAAVPNYDRAEASNARRKERRIPKSDLPDVVTEFTGDREGKTHIPMTLVSVNALEKLGHAFAYDLAKQSLVISHPLTKVQVGEIVNLSATDSVHYNRSGIHALPKFNHRTFTSARSDDSYPASDSRDSQSAPYAIMAGVVYDPGNSWTAFEKHLLSPDTIVRLGYDYEEVRDYFYIHKLLNQDEITELIESSAKDRKYAQGRRRSKYARQPGLASYIHPARHPTNTRVPMYGEIASSYSAHQRPAIPDGGRTPSAHFADDLDQRGGPPYLPSYYEPRYSSAEYDHFRSEQTEENPVWYDHQSAHAYTTPGEAPENVPIYDPEPRPSTTRTYATPRGTLEYVPIYDPEPTHSRPRARRTPSEPIKRQIVRIPTGARSAPYSSSAVDQPPIRSGSGAIPEVQKPDDDDPWGSAAFKIGKKMIRGKNVVFAPPSTPLKSDYGVTLRDKQSIEDDPWASASFNINKRANNGKRATLAPKPLSLSVGSEGELSPPSELGESRKLTASSDSLKLAGSNLRKTTNEATGAASSRNPAFQPPVEPASNEGKPKTARTTPNIPTRHRKKASTANHTLPSCEDYNSNPAISDSERESQVSDDFQQITSEDCRSEYDKSESATESSSSGDDMKVRVGTERRPRRRATRGRISRPNDKLWHEMTEEEKTRSVLGISAEDDRLKRTAGGWNFET